MEKVGSIQELLDFTAGPMGHWGAKQSQKSRIANTLYLQPPRVLDTQTGGTPEQECSRSLGTVSCRMRRHRWARVRGISVVRRVLADNAIAGSALELGLGGGQPEPR